MGPATGYSAVYLIEAVLLLATFFTVSPLARGGSVADVSEAR
jgi:hypothetical protein